MENTQLKDLEEKLQQLLTRYKRLQKENHNLKDELHIAKTDLARAKVKIEEMQQSLDVQNIGVQNLSEQQKQDLSKRIDGYLNDIQKCLNLLNA